MSNFNKLEKEQNLKNIKSVLHNMDKGLNYLEDTITDYAQWDDTYDFIETGNNDYIYENFREGTNTLETLELDFMIFTTLRNKKVYSKYLDQDIYI
jgi:sensor domain CHASE-containing protein